MAYLDFLAKERTGSGTGFNRWLAPPATLPIHLPTYGGGFATAPAYLADMVGSQIANAINNGRLLTARTTAGILGSMLVNYIRDESRAGLGRMDDIAKSRCLVQVMG
jgi:hypothetical protein